MRRESKRSGVFTRRALLIGGTQLAALGFLASKLYQVQVIDGARYATLARNNSVSARLIAPPRGRLLDRFATVVAGNRQNWRALLVAEQTGDITATLDRFAALVSLSEHDRARILREVRQHRRFIPVTIKEFLDWDEMARIEVNAPDLPGIMVDVGTSREYPFGELLAHVVGYVAPPNQKDIADDAILALPGMRVGRAGVERFREVELRGRAGAVQLEVNAVGRVIRELDRQEGTPGEEITLTLDAETQRQVMGHLGQESASSVVLDVQTGEVLAMATNPSFDPSLFNSGISQAQWLQWVSDKRAPLINKAIAGLYSPGSTFKMVVALAGLQAHAITETDRINCPGYLDFGNRRYHCWKAGGHGMLDLHGGLQNSCDVFFYEVARRTGIDAIAAMAHRFGLGTKLDIDMVGVRDGLVPTRAWREAQGKAWNIGDTIVAGIGQGYTQITPLSLAAMVARVATGRAITPHLTRAIGGVVQPGGKAEDWPDMGLPERSMQAVRQGMWAVVNDPHGTAPLAKLALPGVQMAGKTGSVQVRNVSRAQRDNGYKSDKMPWELRPHALFVAYAPFDAPRYALSLVVEHGNAGADTAAPIARDIMTDLLTRDPLAHRAAPQQMASRT
ncbi:MAG: penicillin-binding protein 2 [Rhodospirillales bacterium]|nr:penicillin-binding protein 2 [Rhodospirillales bacterium]MDE2200028.1 penicillin-binding protein 2 [Rhodospirillales bacterium]MDE2574216.1 penicillin-binding protein 2 [Rhodospirillales bacterium]